MARTGSYKLPASLRVGPFTYSVAKISKKAATDEGVFGDCDLDANAIRVASGMSEARTVETLLHEIFHAMFNASGLKGVPALDRHEETIVSALSVTTVQLMRDNPAAVRSMIDALTK